MLASGFTPKCKPYSLLYIILALSGGALALATFSSVWWLQLVAFVAIAPVFLAVRTLPQPQHYMAGLVFFGAWLLPTTYWYYTFMPWWLALLASVGFVALVANLFHLFRLQYIAKIPFELVVMLIGVAWVSFTALRLHLPVLEDWWIPHLGYAVWHNAGPLQIARWGGEVALEALVLTTNALIVIAALRGKRWLTVATVSVVLASIIGLNLFIHAKSSASLPRVAAIQQLTAGGVDVPATQTDLDTLTSSTAQYAEKADIIVWPENSIPPELAAQVASIARKHHVAIVYHTVERDQASTYKKVVIVDENGAEILRNYKHHIAPGEVANARYSAQRTAYRSLSITAYVCYDMHYPDSVQRIGEAKLVFVPINDAAFGTLQRDFHTADMAIRAVQTGASIISASTNGPTVHINQYGVVEQWLPYSTSGVLELAP